MTCPVCLNPSPNPEVFSSGDRLFQTTARVFPLSRCGRCECLFIDPLPSPDDLPAFYPSQYWWHSSPGLLTALESLYRRFALRDHIAAIMHATADQRLSSQSVRLLDIGCGSGMLLSLLRRRGFDVVGFDSSAEAARVAKTNGDVDVVVESCLEKAAFAGDTFDLITLFHVLEHVPDPREVLAEVRRILRPHGRILVQVPNIESWQARLCGRRWYGLDIPRHVIHYSPRSLRHLLSDCGFRVRRTRHFNLRDNAPALASSLFPGLDPVSRTARRGDSKESAALAWTKHAAYLSVVAGVFPIAVAEALAGAGGTVMVEAEKA